MESGTVADCSVLGYRRFGRREVLGKCMRRLALLAVIACAASMEMTVADAQELEAASPASESAGEQGNPDLAPPASVGITPQADDQEIERRLTNILEATTWFQAPQASVDEGVVFLRGMTSSEDHKIWAGNLARNTQDVVAVVNRIEVRQRSVWDMTPAWLELQQLGREIVQSLPRFAVGLAVLVLVWFVSAASVRWSRHLLRSRLKNRLLLQVLSRAVAVPIFLLGLYFALRVSGLTQIAATVIGGTGLFGLMLGIAFRDIAENFLASILISVQRPFALGDLIDVEGREGIVQSVTSRGTLLMTLEGNHVQIPNAVIYKSIIQNKTANPNIRSDFGIGIDYGDAISEAQQVLLEVLQSHPAVLAEPAPMILVEELGAATVNLRVYFWVNGHEHSVFKVKSSVVRLSKLAIESAGLTMPDEAREVIFPKGVPVRMLEERDATGGDERRPTVALPSPTIPSKEASQVVSPAESGLTAEQGMLEEQARRARVPEEGENLFGENP